MRRAALLVGLLFLPLAAQAAEYPAPDGFVNDKVRLLSPDVRNGLEQKLKAYEKATSIELAVLIVPTLGGEELAAYARNVWHSWHIGKKGQDNGVLLLVVPPPEKKAWIETSYGVQGWLTDIASKHIVSDVMRPLNLQEKRTEAVVAGVDAIIAKLGTTSWAERAKAGPPKPESGWPTWATIAIIIGVILLVLLLIRTDDGPMLFVILSGLSDGGGGGSSSSSGGGFSDFGGGGDSGGGGGGDSG